MGHRSDLAKIYRDMLSAVTAKPETSYDNFLRDFGERFVPGYKTVSTVDVLINAPFAE